MSYSPTSWIEKVTKLGPTNLNKLELGVQATAVVADAALPTPAGSNGQFLKRVGGVWVPTSFSASDIPSFPTDATKALLGDGTWAQIANAQIAAAAAIAISKLAGFPSDATKILKGDGTWAAPRRIVTGEITGATAAITKGTGFTVSRTSAGVYAVTITVAFGAAPVVLITTTNGAPSGYSALGTGSLNILTFNSSFAAADENFNFILVETA
jgi:hypothetical protein